MIHLFYSLLRYMFLIQKSTPLLKLNSIKKCTCTTLINLLYTRFIQITPLQRFRQNLEKFHCASLYIPLHKKLYKQCSTKKAVNVDSTTFTAFECAPKLALIIYSLYKSMMLSKGATFPLIKTLTFAFPGFISYMYCFNSVLS